MSDVSDEELKAQGFVGRAVGDDEMRQDGWANYLTGLNTMRDKRTAHVIFEEPAIPDLELEAMFAGDDMAYRIIAELPETAMRQSFEIYDTDSNDAEKSSGDAKKLQDACNALEIDEYITESAIWGRLFGGAGIIINAVGAGLPDQPLGPNPRITSLTVLDRRYLQVVRLYSNPLEPDFGEPELFSINSLEIGAPAQVLVHASRVIIFPGARTSRRRRQRNNWWDDSVLQRISDVLRDANSNWQSVTHLMTDASQAVYKIAGLTQMIAGNFNTTLHQRMEAIELGRSVARAVLLDANEDFTRIATSFTGLPEVIRETWIRLSAAADMPVTVLMKQSPNGLNATGDSDIEIWYGTVQAYRENLLRSRIEEIVRLVAVSIGDANPSRWSIRFPPLKQLSAKERAEVEKTTADKDVAYVGAGVLRPAEVALSRYGKGEWSPETTIDAQAREAELAQQQPRPVDAGAAQGTPPANPTGQ